MRTLGHLLLVGGLLAALPLWADEKGPCGEDAKTACAGVPFGKGMVFECLVKKKASLSAGCQAHIQKSLDYKKACEKEIARECGESSFFCLLYASKSKAPLSDACLDKVLEGATYRKQCGRELRQYCPNHQATREAMLSCLEKRELVLSHACRSNLKK